METIKFNNQEILVNPRSEVEVSVLREIFKIREYRAAEAAIKSAQDPILDVGAHVGFFTLYCRALNARVPVVALEPEDHNLASLRAHLKANQTTKVTVVVGGLTAQTGKRNLQLSADSHNHRILPLGKIAAANEAVQLVPVFSLADLCQSRKIKHLSLLKMDIEGGEYELLEAWSERDFSLFKCLLMEYHNKYLNNRAKLEKILREQGFGVQIFPSKFDKTMGIIMATNKRV